MRLFIKIREYALSNKELFQKIKEMETKYDGQFDKVFKSLNYLLKEKAKPKIRTQIGYKITSK